MSAIDTPKRKPGRPRVDSEEVSLRMHRELLDKIDQWRSKAPDEPNRPEAIRRLVAKALK